MPTIEELDARLKKLEARANDFVPVGTMLAFAGPRGSIPQGWLECNGNPISRTKYAALFAEIGETWGQADDVNDFDLPDLRGRFLRGVDAGVGRDDVALRTPNGVNNKGDAGSTQEDAFGQHRHGPSKQGTAFIVYAGGDSYRRS